MKKQARKIKKITLEDLATLTLAEINKLENKLTAEIRNTANGAKEELKTELNKKVDIFTHKSLEYRVEKLEEKMGAAKKK